jgi:hypothetical protein
MKTQMTPQMTNLHKLKTLDLSDTSVTLAVVKEYKRIRLSQYSVKYVQINERLERRLRDIILEYIKNSNTVEKYSFDCPEPETDQIRAIEYERTDFYRILTQLNDLNPEEDTIENVDELVKSKAYLIILRIAEGIQIVGFKTLPENWKLKKSKGLIPLLFKENRFEDIDEKNIFSISSSIDFFYYNEFLFILSKKEFERGLNFRESMINNANTFYEEANKMNLFINMDILTQKVGNNQRYLRMIAKIKDLEYYKNTAYLKKLQQLNVKKGWDIQFEDEQIVITEDNLDTVLRLLQNKRLHSEITEEDFDVESTKPVEN